MQSKFLCQLKRKRTKINKRRNNAVFLVGDIPEAFQTDDGVTQESIEEIIALERTLDSQFIQGFHDQRPKKVKLSVMRSEYSKGKSRTAIQRLRSRHAVDIDEELKYQKNDPRLAWGAREHYLDYYLLVPESKGLHVVLPTARGDPSYVFKLDVQHRYKTWQARYADLEFNPTGRMLYIGMYGQEEIWLAMVSRSFTNEEVFEDDADMEDLRASINCLEMTNTTTQMKDEHYSKMMLFLAYQLKRQGYRDIYLRENYPEDLSPSNLKNLTNLM